jgi:hypothetical protein
MSVERAAGLAGMQVSEWCALEAGWVPHTPGVLRAVADTLELGYSQLSFLAEISEFNQIDPAQNLSLGVVLINIYAHLRGRPARKRR